jgi:hypothetical protein
MLQVPTAVPLSKSQREALRLLLKSHSIGWPNLTATDSRDDPWYQYPTPRDGDGLAGGLIFTREAKLDPGVYRRLTAKKGRSIVLGQDVDFPAVGGSIVAFDRDSIVFATTVGESSQIRDSVVTNSVLRETNLNRSTVVSCVLTGTSIHDSDFGASTITHGSAYETTVRGLTLVLNGTQLTKGLIRGAADYIRVGPVGSRGAYVTLYRTQTEGLKPDGGHRVQTGCFSGTLKQFRLAVTRSTDKQVRREYGAVIALFSARVRWWARKP